MSLRRNKLTQEMSFYDLFKRNGMSRYVVSNAETLVPVQPVAPPIKAPKLKRTAFRAGKAAGTAPPARRIRGTSDRILRGHFKRLMFQSHDGFVIGRFKLWDAPTEYTVRGTLPVVDMQYCYQLKCTELFNNSAVEYRIESLFSTKEFPALTVLPLTGQFFCQLLINHCGLRREDAQKIVFEVYRPLAKPEDFNARKSLKITKIILEFEYICNNFSETPWFNTLSLSWNPLRYRGFPKLLEVGWSAVELSKLNATAIAELTHDLSSNPWNYLVADRNQFRLPPIPVTRIHTLNNLFGTKIGDTDVKCIKFYELISARVEDTKQISLNMDDFARIAQENRIAEEIKTAVCLPHRRLIKVFYERHPSIQEPRYYRYHEFEALQRLSGHFERLARQSVKSIPPPTPTQQERNNEIWEGFNPNPQQLECYQRLSNYNILLIDGGPGSGKSTMMRVLRTRYNDSVVGFFVAYGVIASGLSSNLGMQFSTLAMAVDQIEKGGAGADAFLRLQVAFIDELSLIDVVLLERFLRLMIGLKVLIMAGDYCQCSSIAPGPVIYGLLRKWKDTPYTVQFTDYYRAQNPILLDNLNLLRQGKYNIQYSTNLESDHPFILQHRHELPEQVRNGGEIAKLAQVSILKKDLEPIYQYYIDNKPETLDNTMLCAQRIKDVALLNHAWWCLKFDKPIDAPYSESEFSVGETVMFCGENLNNPDHKRAKHLRSTRVMHGSTAVIASIWDFAPFWHGEKDDDSYYEGARSVDTTGAAKEYHLDRVIRFTNGMQINLRDYPLSKLKRGYAVTTVSTQGLQCELLIYYIQPGETPYLTRQEFYTGCSRAKNRVIVICEAKHESLHVSDISRISRNEFRLATDIMPVYLPEFKEKFDFTYVAPEPEGNPFENLGNTELQALSSSSLFGGFFSGLKLSGDSLVNENANV